jgi:hypothetical protein
MEKAIAYTYASDDLAYYFGERVKNSFEHFHPGVPFNIITPFDEKEIFGDVKIPIIGAHFTTLNIRYLNYLKDKYEVVIKLDADVVITGRLDEFLDGDYDVACSLNCPGVGGIDYQKYPDYCNLGVTAVRSKEFAEEWFKLTYDHEFISKMNFGYLEQDIMNYLATCGKYKQLIVDKGDTAPYYNETSREQWDKLKIRHKGLFIGDRQVKAMHWAGGGEMCDKYTHPLIVSEDVQKFLNEITKTKDFTNAKTNAERKIG